MSLTLDEHTELMKGRTRPLTQDPVQLRRATTDHQLNNARLAGSERLATLAAARLAQRKADRQARR